MMKKCVICGAEPKFESMTLTSPVCEKCAKKMVKMLSKDKPVEDLIEEFYVPFAGDVTEIRENK